MRCLGHAKSCGGSRLGATDSVPTRDRTRNHSVVALNAKSRRKKLPTFAAATLSVRGKKRKSLRRTYALIHCERPSRGRCCGLMPRSVAGLDAPSTTSAAVSALIPGNSRSYVSSTVSSGCPGGGESAASQTAIPWVFRQQILGQELDRSDVALPGVVDQPPENRSPVVIGHVAVHQFENSTLLGHRRPAASSPDQVALHESATLVTVRLGLEWTAFARVTVRWWRLLWLEPPGRWITCWHLSSRCWAHLLVCSYPSCTGHCPVSRALAHCPLSARPFIGADSTVSALFSVHRLSGGHPTGQSK